MIFFGKGNADTCDHLDCCKTISWLCQTIMVFFERAITVILGCGSGHWSVLGAGYFPNDFTKEFYHTS
uniref:Uncharacterized protein n=1 Tax=Kalanchoe fedtschenkoi TaxID=63787 RepID=A0A7N0UMZ1_KALFE